MLAEPDHPATFNPGQFLNNVQKNWKQGSKPNTRLTQEQMAAFEQLQWFPDVLAGWQQVWEDPAGRRQPVGRTKSASGRGDWGFAALAQVDK